MNCLCTSYNEANPEPFDGNKDETAAISVQEVVLLTLGHGSSWDDPQAFEETWNHPDPEMRKGWRDAIQPKSSRT